MVCWITRAVGALVAVLTVLAVFAPSAAAHDELISSTPAAGEQLESAPSEITLEFSAALLDLGGASTVVFVVDASGTDWAAEQPVIEHNVVRVSLKPSMPDAGYEVRWQVISGDGHPISGIVAFTVGDAAPLSPAPTASASQPQSEATTSGPRLVWVALGGAAIAIAAYALVLFISRRKAQQ